MSDTPYQGVLLGGQSGKLDYQIEKLDLAKQVERRNRLQQMANNALEAMVHGRYPSLQRGSETDVAMAFLYGYPPIRERRYIKQAASRLPKPAGDTPDGMVYQPERSLWPFGDEAERLRRQAIFQTATRWTFYAIGVLLLWALSPVFWWFIRAWGWAFR